METFKKVPTLESLLKLYVQKSAEQEAKYDLILSKLSSQESPLPKFIDVQGLRNYLQEKIGKKPATQTVYGWVTNRKIPYEKFGKELRFEVDRIDVWLNNGRQMNHLKDD